MAHGVQLLVLSAIVIAEIAVLYKGIVLLRKSPDTGEAIVSENKSVRRLKTNSVVGNSASMIVESLLRLSAEFRCGSSLWRLYSRGDSMPEPDNTLSFVCTREWILTTSA